MSLNVAAGHNQFSGTYIPEIWSRKVLKKFYDASVLGFITNTEYEGEIKNFGDDGLIKQIYLSRDPL